MNNQNIGASIGRQNHNRIIKTQAKVITHKVIGTGVYDLWIEQPDIANTARPGQFIAIYCQDGSRLLPRPISICEIDKEKGLLRLVYRVVGKGTKEFSQLSIGDSIQVLGALGNGFNVNKGTALVIGGGIGIPPLLELCKNIDGDIHIVLGYRDEVFLVNEFEKYGNVYISTQDGSTGTKGIVMDVLKELPFKPDVIYSCGPKPMLKGIQEFALQNNIQAQLSVEEKMACGIGACLGCICKTTEADGSIRFKRVCKEGPVFLASEVIL